MECLFPLIIFFSYWYYNNYVTNCIFIFITKLKAEIYWKGYESK